MFRGVRKGGHESLVQEGERPYVIPQLWAGTAES
jgi:hypothetical protein